VKSSTNHGTSRTPSQRNWQSALHWSWDPKLNKISLSLSGVPMPRRARTSCQLSISVSSLMLTSLSDWRTVLKTSWRQTITIAWRSSSETGRRLPSNKESKSSWLAESKCLIWFARRSYTWPSTMKRSFPWSWRKAKTDRNSEFLSKTTDPRTLTSILPL